MNLLDIVLIIVALAVAALTFTQPPLVTFAELLACYAAAAAAGLFYLPLAAVPVFSVLPFAERATLELSIFVLLLIGGGLLLRNLARRIAALVPDASGFAGPIGPVISALLSASLALVVVLVVVLLTGAFAQMPSGAGLPTFAREQAAGSDLIARLDLPLGLFLRAVGVWSGGVLPPVYRDLVYVLSPL